MIESLFNGSFFCLSENKIIAFREQIETVINEQDISTVTEIEKKLEKLQKQLLIRANSKEDYNDIADEIYRLGEEKHNALAEDVEKKAAG